MKKFGLVFFIVLMALAVTGCGKKSGLEGKVVDGKGKPMANVKIIAKQIQPIKGYEQFETTTGSDGTFSFEKLFPTSEYVLFPWFDDWSSAPQRTLKYEANKLTARFNKEGWTTEDKMKVQSGPEGQTIILKSPIAILPTASIFEGKIQDGKHKPMANIKIVAKQKHPVSGYEQFEVVTGSDGTFSFVKLFPFSKYTLIPKSELWKTNVKRVIMTAGEQEQKTLKDKLTVRFTFGSGVVADSDTGLMWAAHDNNYNISWHDAKEYCATYNSGGFSDWRLPTSAELMSLYKAGIRIRSNRGDNIINIITITACCPWASETRGSEVAYFRFYDGVRDWYGRSIMSYPHRVLPVRSITYSKKGLATHKKLYDFFDVFKAAAIERDVEKMRNLSHPQYLSCVNDKLYQNIINAYFNVFNQNVEIKEVKVEDISKEDKEAIMKEGWGMAGFPDKRISFSYGGEVAGGGYSGGGGSILLSLHNGEWKWVSFCNLPPVNKQYLKKVANAKANSDIKNAFTASMAFHVDFPEATVDIIKLREYGFKESEGVTIRIIDGRANYLKIEGKHKDGSEVFVINTQGISHRPKGN
ncbi:MAG: DUF1566 domain-containing protein [Candidatus Electryonea clarkiae]|nr:DUF1566 domain-containing protein [Candidatus Electryonea clarkiae]